MILELCDSGISFHLSLLRCLTAGWQIPVQCQTMHKYEKRKALVIKPSVSLVVCLVNVFLYLDCRAEIHDVLEEYKEGAAKFMGKVQVFACVSER